MAEEEVMAKRVSTFHGLVRHWYRLANKIERMEAAGPKDHGLVVGLRAAAWDLDELLKRKEKA